MMKTEKLTSVVQLIFKQSRVLIQHDRSFIPEILNWTGSSERQLTISSLDLFVQSDRWIWEKTSDGENYALYPHSIIWHFRLFDEFASRRICHESCTLLNLLYYHHFLLSKEYPMKFSNRQISTSRKHSLFGSRVLQDFSHA